MKKYISYVVVIEGIKSKEFDGAAGAVAYLEDMRQGFIVSKPRMAQTYREYWREVSKRAAIIRRVTTETIFV
jgi:hypothetical protein